MRRTKLLYLAILAVIIGFAFALPAVSAEVPPEVRMRAAGIFAALDKIAAEQGRSAPASSSTLMRAPGSRSLTFTEDEFNAYVACRLDDENEPYVKAAEFKLLAGDKIEGRITIDLGKPPASGILPQKQDLLFAARVESREGMIRINMDSLFLGTQPIAPAFVDIIIAVVSRLQGVEPTSLKDWYDLPPGVQRLETRPGRVVVIY